MDINLDNTVRVSVESTVIASFDRESQSVVYSVYPKGHAWRANDGEIAITENFLITMELPYLNEVEMQQKAVETLKARQAKVYAEAELEFQNLQKKIDSLLLLGCDSSQGIEDAANP
jgi:hypothetical protein